MKSIWKKWKILDPQYNEIRVGIVLLQKNQVYIPLSQEQHNYKKRASGTNTFYQQTLKLADQFLKVESFWLILGTFFQKKIRYLY